MAPAIWARAVGALHGVRAAPLSNDASHDPERVADRWPGESPDPGGERSGTSGWPPAPSNAGWASEGRADPTGYPAQ